MKINYSYFGKSRKLLKTFIHEQGISRKLLAKIKFQGGKILVNNEEKNVRYLLCDGDRVELVIPDEKGNDLVTPDATPLDILYEDEFLLIVNKPVGVASVPVSAHLEGTMVNRVKNHLLINHNPDLKVHTVTRLDRETSGAMMFAKNGYVHSLMDKKLRERKIKKYYQLLVYNHGDLLEKHGRICEPIARKKDSIIKRVVSSEGKFADTEYWIIDQKDEYAYLKVLLHTGRTHQIRVHMTYMDAPLLGDTLYNEYLSNKFMKRQALHCAKLEFNHPITNEKIEIEAGLPDDMKKIYQEIFRS